MTRGYIIPIGGAEEKIGEPRILKRFAALCGKWDAKIAIIPTASKLAETGPNYQALFEEMGVSEARVLPIESREEAERPGMIEALADVNGIFLTGGNQLRLSTILGGTQFAKTIRHRNQEGVHVAGTSAGAAFVSSHMIASGVGGPTPRPGKVTLAPGLGLTNSVIVDQHFRQRNRLGRLLTALAYNPFAAGIGLDEDTAAFIAPDYTVEAYGSGAITVVDPSQLKHSSIAEARDHDAVCMLDVRLHILTEGATFHIKTKVAKPPPN